jgi:hypothetical protein
MPAEPTWEELASEFERIPQNHEPLRVELFEYEGCEGRGLWWWRPENANNDSARASFGLLAARAIGKLKIAPNPIPTTTEYFPVWRLRGQSKDEFLRNADTLAEMSIEIPFGLGDENKDALDPCSRAWLEVLRKRSRAYRESTGNELRVRELTFLSTTGSMPNVCVESATLCRRIARDEIKERLHRADDILGEPLLKNPYQTVDPRYRGLESYFEMMDQCRLLAPAVDDVTTTEAGIIAGAAKSLAHLPGFYKADAEMRRRTEPILQEIERQLLPAPQAIDWLDAHAECYATLVIDHQSWEVYRLLLDKVWYPKAYECLFGSLGMLPLLPEGIKLASELDARRRHWHRQVSENLAAGFGPDHGDPDHRHDTGTTTHQRRFSNNGSRLEANRKSDRQRADTLCCTRAKTVATIIEELNTLRPQMFEDESEYNRLRTQYPQFLVFNIADDRPDLRMKIRAIQGSVRHIRLAQELAGAFHGRKLSTIQKDWKNFKPDKFRRQ